MRPRLLLLLALPFLVAGCTGGGDGGAGGDVGSGGASPPAPVEAYNETMDYTGDLQGAPRETRLQFPADARSFTLEVSWRPSGGAPVGTVSNVRIEVTDADDAVVAACEIGRAGVTMGGQCDPVTNGTLNGPYTLTWYGAGRVVIHVRVTTTAASDDAPRGDAGGEG